MKQSLAAWPSALVAASAAPAGNPLHQAAVLVVDIVRPGARSAVLATAFAGLAVTAALTVTTGATAADAFGGAQRQGPQGFGIEAVEARVENAR